MEPIFPNDDNGNVLRAMYEDGDDLSKPRFVEFFHLFKHRSQAIAFIDALPDKGLVFILSFYVKKEMWEVNARKKIAPEYGEISKLECFFKEKAEGFEGVSDGWGSLQIK